MSRVALAPARSPDARKAKASVSRYTWQSLVSDAHCLLESDDRVKSYCLNCDSEEPGCVHCEMKSRYGQSKVWLETSQQLPILRILPHMFMKSGTG